MFSLRATLRRPVVSRLLTLLDGLISELGSDAYNSVVDAAWEEINAVE